MSSLTDETVSPSDEALYLSDIISIKSSDKILS